MPNRDTSKMGELDILEFCGIPRPIKGVMYCTVDWLGLGEREPPNDCIIFQDALGEYHFYYDFSQGGGEYLAKFKAPRGTSVSDFVKHHFQGARMGVDMDRYTAKHKLSMQ